MKTIHNDNLIEVAFESGHWFWRPLAGARNESWDGPLKTHAQMLARIDAWIYKRVEYMRKAGMLPAELCISIRKVGQDESASEQTVD